MIIRKTREEIETEIKAAAGDDVITEEDLQGKIEAALAAQESEIEAEIIIEAALAAQESEIEAEIINEGNKILGSEQPTTEYTVFVNIKHYVKVQASSKEEAFEKLKAHDFGQYIESPKDVRWHNETVIP